MIPALHKSISLPELVCIDGEDNDQSGCHLLPVRLHAKHDKTGHEDRDDRGSDKSAIIFPRPPRTEVPPMIQEAIA